MKNLLVDLHIKEEGMLKSLEESGMRLLSRDMELSDILSELKHILFNLFPPKKLSKNDKHNIRDILKYCEEMIKIEYERTKNLNSLEFSVWHLSMFMTIHTFMEIIELKYDLKRKNKIMSLFDELLEEDFYEFIDLNSKLKKIRNITGKLINRLDFKELKVFFGYSEGKFVWEDSYKIIKYDKEENYKIIQTREKKDISKIIERLLKELSLEEREIE